MTERSLVKAAIIIFGLWRIFISAFNELYYLVEKLISPDFSHPATRELRGLIYEVLVGVLIIIAAPAATDLIYGRKSSQP